MTTEPKITARWFTARIRALRQDCDACGRPGWSVNGVTVAKHEADADDEACPALPFVLLRHVRAQETP